jgi:pyridoxal 5'-phosphate synthase pdxT subunit
VTRLPGAPFLRPRSPRSVAGVTAAGPSDVADLPVVGVLALQGDVIEHVRAIEACGLPALPVRTPADLVQVAALVLPGGESTTLSRLLVRGGLLGPLQERIAAQMPVLATCAGLILLSEQLDTELPRPGGLAVRTRRNAYGSQQASFDALLEIVGLTGGPLDASFIRAPQIEAILTPEVEVLAQIDGQPVVVRQGDILAMSFHPEVTGDLRLHAWFCERVRARAAR